MSRTPAWPPKSLPRLYVEAPLAEDATIELSREQANYLGNVMRLGESDKCLIFNGANGEWGAEISAASKKSMALTAREQTREQEAVPDVTLAFAPVKKGRIDWLVEKAVELGVAKLQPVITERTIVRDVKLDRLRAHVIEAAEQCGRTALAELAEPIKLSAYVDARDGSVPLYFADENGGEPPSTTFAPPPAIILTGPEGGFTDAEREAIRSAPATAAISLGPRILRAETAALAAIASYMALAGDWR